VPYALGRIAPGTASAPEVIAALADFLHDPNPEAPRVAAHALGNFGPAAAGAVPDLVKAFRKVAAVKRHQRDPLALDWLAAALGRIAPGTPTAKVAVQVLSEALNSEDLEVQSAALKVLPQFGRDAKSALPRLAALEKDSRSSVSKSAAEARKKLEAAP
jgi:HEAT repeat protein